MESFNERQRPVKIEFPLRGEWTAPTTPAKKIPSHGTDQMGLRYAFDFVRADGKDLHKEYDAGFWRFFLFGVPLERFYCYGEKIYAPCDGEIVELVDGIRERKTVHWVRESFRAVKNALTFDENNDEYSLIAGNYLVMKCSDEIYMAFVHLKTDSITVSLNEKIKQGTLLGRVGHSGNSTSPHLHFQVMDSADIKNSRGLPCCFEEYEVYQNGEWKTVHGQIPSWDERIRFYKN